MDSWAGFSLVLSRACPTRPLVYPCISVQMESMQLFPEGRLFNALKDRWFSVSVLLWTYL